MRRTVIFFVLLLWPLSIVAAERGERPAPAVRSTRSTAEYAPSRLPHPPMALSRPAGGAATTIRKLTSAKDRQICVEGHLGWRPFSTGRALNPEISVGDSGAFRGS